MADQTSPGSAQERAATLPASGEGKETAGGLAEAAARTTMHYALCTKKSRLAAACIFKQYSFQLSAHLYEILNARRYSGVVLQSAGKKCDAQKQQQRHNHGHQTAASFHLHPPSPIFFSYYTPVFAVSVKKV